MRKEFQISTTHDGRPRITTFSLCQSWRVSLLLMFRYGFYRWGMYVPPITDEAIHLSYFRGRLKIDSGWDNWFGYDWYSANSETDAFLLRFYEKHCCSK